MSSDPLRFLVSWSVRRECGRAFFTFEDRLQEPNYDVNVKVYEELTRSARKVKVV